MLKTLMICNIKWRVFSVGVVILHTRSSTRLSIHEWPSYIGRSDDAVTEFRGASEDGARIESDKYCDIIFGNMYVCSSAELCLVNTAAAIYSSVLLISDIQFLTLEWVHVAPF